MELATKEHTFITKYPHQRLVITPDRPVRNSAGERIGVKPGRSVQFEGNVLRVVGDEVVGVDEGKLDENGDVVLSRKPLVEWLRGHVLFNIDFYDRGSPPDEPKPTVAEQVAAISRATEPEQIEAVVAVEKQTHKRDLIFEAAAAALDRISDDGGAEEKAPSPSPSYRQN